jgi:hypothetical protein
MQRRRFGGKDVLNSEPEGSTPRKGQGVPKDESTRMGAPSPEHEVVAPRNGPEIDEPGDHVGEVGRFVRDPPDLALEPLRDDERSAPFLTHGTALVGDGDHHGGPHRLGRSPPLISRSGAPARSTACSNALTEIRHGLVVEAELGSATGTIEREADRQEGAGSRSAPTRALRCARVSRSARPQRYAGETGRSTAGHDAPSARISVAC